MYKKRYNQSLIDSGPSFTLMQSNREHRKTISGAALPSIVEISREEDRTLDVSLTAESRKVLEKDPVMLGARGREMPSYSRPAQ